MIYKEGVFRRMMAYHQFDGDDGEENTEYEAIAAYKHPHDMLEPRKETEKAAHIRAMMTNKRHDTNMKNTPYYKKTPKFLAKSLMREGRGIQERTRRSNDA